MTGPQKKTAAAQPKKLVVTTADEWFAGAEGQIIELPSGRCVRLRMPGIQAFISADLIPNELMPIILGAIQKFEPVDDADLRKIQSDPQMLLQLAYTMDKIFAYCVTEPKFEVVPTFVDDQGRTMVNEGGKEPQVLYTDLVSDDDKSYVFNCAVGGVRDLETFRAEQAAAMEAVQAGSNVAVSTKRVAGAQ